MEVDIGTEFSVFPSSVWKEQFTNVCLNKSRASLRSYGGSSLSVLGECIVDVRYESCQFRDTIVVVEGSGQPLFGRNWMSHVIIDWSNFRNAQANALPLDSLLRQFPTVFQEGPWVLLYRPVPYAVRAKVEAECSRLEGEGIIKPVSNADLASPVVVVKKKKPSSSAFTLILKCLLTSTLRPTSILFPAGVFCYGNYLVDLYFPNSISAKLVLS